MSKRARGVTRTGSKGSDSKQDRQQDQTVQQQQEVNCGGACGGSISGAPLPDRGGTQCPEHQQGARR
jgi:hypothetical protein